MTKHVVAIVGATGAVGQELLQVLAARRFPVRSLRLLASPRSAGRTLSFQGEAVPVQALGRDSFRGVDVALFAAGSAVAREQAPLAVAAGALVVDNSSAFRRDPAVPLVVPEVNAAALAGHRGLIANPNCSTILASLALGPLHRQAGLRAVVVSTYQAASGAGQQAVHELRAAFGAWLANEPPVPPQALPQTLAANVFPQVDVFEADGYTREEDKLLHELRRILDLPALRVEATCVRVPVERCHSEAISADFERQLSVDGALRVLREAPGLHLVEASANPPYPMPRDWTGRDDVAVGRVRAGRVFGNGVSFWLCGDQLRKGAALNAVQIAEQA